MNDQDKYSRTIREFEQKAHNGAVFVKVVGT